MAGALLGLTGLLGLSILILDRILWSLASTHAYGLILFVVIDFAVAGLLLVRPSSTAFTLAAAWGALRIVIQAGDVFVAPTFGMNYAEFAGYLFNPMAMNSPNPPGVPGAMIDLILLLEVIVIGVALIGRTSR